MGLDMYLYAERYVSKLGYLNPDEPAMYELITKTIGSDTLPNPELGSITIKQCVGYWRKANAIHGWFIKELANGVDECQDIYVPKEAIIKLRDNCVSALANRHNAKTNEQSDYVIKIDDSIDPKEAITKIIDSMAKEANNTKTIADEPLAPTAGFFFGSTEKDEWYYEQLEYTIELINSLLAHGDKYEYYYRASW